MYFIRLGTMKLFGSSGIRGVVNKDITPQLALDIGRAVGSASKRVVIGRDTRVSGEMLLHAISSGLLSAGADVSDAGILGTPTLAHAARKFDCGVMITASHNPSQYNGVKLWNPDGSSFGTAQMLSIEDAILNKKFNAPPWNGIGAFSKHRDAISEHSESILSAVRPANLKVVLDCGSGGASTITPYLLGKMGCKVITLNCQPDGHFPGRDPEPIDANLSDLKNAVKSCKADLGIAHDGDADRVMAVDETGRLLSGDQLLCVFASEIVKKKIVVPVDASMLIDDMLPGVEVIRTKVGDVYVSEAIKAHNADFGGEPSGTWVFPKISYCPDAIYAAAKLVEMAAKEKLSARLSKFKSYPIKRISVSYSGMTKDELKSKLDKELSAIDCKGINKIDGLRLEFGDAWALVRLSGTEPKVRAVIEGRNETRVKEISGKIEGIISKCISKK